MKRVFTPLLNHHYAPLFVSAALRLLFGFILLLQPGDAPAMQGLQVLVLLWTVMNTIFVVFWFIRSRVKARVNNPAPLGLGRTVALSAAADVLVGAVLLLRSDTPLAFFILTFAIYLIAHGFALLLVPFLAGRRRRQATEKQAA